MEAGPSLVEGGTACKTCVLVLGAPARLELKRSRAVNAPLPCAPGDRRSSSTGSGEDCGNVSSPGDAGLVHLDSPFVAHAGRIRFAIAKA